MRAYSSSHVFRILACLVTLAGVLAGISGAQAHARPGHQFRTEMLAETGYLQSSALTNKWPRRFGSIGRDIGYSTATDMSGNVFVTGCFSGTVDFGGGGLTSAGVFDILLAKYDAYGNHLWSKRFGGSYSKGFSVATDGSGNVIMTGYFVGTADFGDGPTSSKGSDIILAKYDADGNHLWSKQFGDYYPSGDLGHSVATDGSGNVILTGEFGGMVDFGGGGLTSAGERDIILAKYDADGNHLWSKRFGGPSYDYGYSVAMDASGNVFVTGQFQGTADFGGGELESANGGLDIFLAKYDASGNHLWSKRFGSELYDIGLSTATDGSGNVFITGAYQDTADFGSGELSSAGGNDIFLAKYDASGNHLWSRSFGGTDNEIGYSTATDGAGNVFVTGYFGGMLDFGCSGPTSNGTCGAFLAKFSANGNYLWSRHFVGSGSVSGNSVATDDSGNVFVTGSFYGTVDFGRGGLTSAGLEDIFLAKYGLYQVWLPVIVKGQ